MIQRIQTIYLFLIPLVCFVAFFCTDLFFVIDQKISKIWELYLGFCSIFALYALFSFKSRKKQFVINRINILINLMLIGVLVYQTLKSSGGEISSMKGVSVIVPVISIVLLFLANKAIQRDENLVKSVDRLR